MHTPPRLLPPASSLVPWILLVMLLLPSTAFSHRVNIFAWAEGNTVNTEATFSSGNKAQKSHVIASESQSGAVIAEGDTDADGLWHFTLSGDILQRKPDILITLSAGEGHANTWTVTAADYAGAAPDPANTTEATQTPSGSSVSGDMPPYMEDTTPSTVETADSLNISKQELQHIVESAINAALEKKLAPIRKQLAEEAQHTPSLQDILGGIGYILGLMGVAAFMAAKKRG